MSGMMVAIVTILMFVVIHTYIVNFFILYKKFNYFRHSMFEQECFKPILQKLCIFYKF